VKGGKQHRQLCPWRNPPLHVLASGPADLPSDSPALARSEPPGRIRHLANSHGLELLLVLVVQGRVNLHDDLSRHAVDQESADPGALLVLDDLLDRFERRELSLLGKRPDRPGQVVPMDLLDVGHGLGHHALHRTLPCLRHVVHLVTSTARYVADLETSAVRLDQPETTGNERPRNLLG